MILAPSPRRRHPRTARCAARAAGLHLAPPRARSALPVAPPHRLRLRSPVGGAIGDQIRLVGRAPLVLEGRAVQQQLAHGIDCTCYYTENIYVRTPIEGHFTYEGEEAFCFSWDCQNNISNFVSIENHES